MRSLAAVLTIAAVAAVTFTACQGSGTSSPTAAAPETPAFVLNGEGAVEAMSKKGTVVYPPNGTCSTEVSGAYTCTTCVSASGNVITITCVPTVRSVLQ
jgi:hypothetical protein